tara:strand:+ start:180 stop:1010 length:831 start_codon:yes stop_codon:yes gene_type:complete
MEKNFSLFLNQLSETNATLDYYVDFDKIISKISKLKIKLNQLNYLIGHDNLKEGVKELFIENNSVFEALEILIATRKKDNKKTLNKEGNVVSLKSYKDSADKIYIFLIETGLSDIFKNKNITNLVDYVFGVEVGLDTNARKNRGGKQMEKAVRGIFKSNKIIFSEQTKHTDFPELKGMGLDIKRFDFSIKTKKATYLIETNYYNSGGSKLNETSRAYIDVANKINKNNGFEFVWITDGQGWLTAKNKLEEAYNSINHVYNLTSLKSFITNIQQNKV